MTAKRGLDVISVKEPCPEDWAGMQGDDEVRFCGLCRKNVYDLSAMTRARAEALLSEREGRLCVRFYRRADGTVSTVDCAPIRFAALRKAARRTLTGAAALFVALLSMVSALGLFRASDFDVAGWLEGTAIGQLAKGAAPEVGRMIDPEPLMGEPMPADWEMGEETETPPHE
ncbi:MAG TPA: hypothetical protein DEF51_34195 [Myxococcales bacterium]|nr:hypothetical protein [Myxococcales bacterium]